MSKKFIIFNRGPQFKVNLPNRETNIIDYKINETIISNSAFEGYKIPFFNTYGATIIQENAYKNAKGFEKIFIPKEITHIGDNAFFGTEINEIIFEPGVNFTNFSTTAFIELSGQLNVFYDSNDISEYDLSNIMVNTDSNFKKINEFSFVKTIDNKNWISVDQSIPSQITIHDISNALESNALEKKDLKEIVFSTQIVEISNNTFKDCLNLKILEFGTHISLTMDVDISLTTIGDSAFQNDISLVKVLFPKSITSIGKDAFKGCSNLEFIHFPAFTSADIICQEESFYDISKNLTVNFVCTGGMNDMHKIRRIFDSACDPSTNIIYKFSYNAVEPDF